MVLSLSSVSINREVPEGKEGSQTGDDGFGLISRERLDGGLWQGNKAHIGA